MPRGTRGMPMIECPRCHGSGKIEASAVSVGDLFTMARKARGMTQEEAAARLGISRPQLTNIEADRGKPSFEVLVAAAELYGTTTDYLTGRRPPAPTT